MARNSGPVKSTMTGAARHLDSKSGSAVGAEMDRNAAPFDKPHDTGNGGIPTVFCQTLGAKTASSHSAGMADATAGNNRERKPMGDRRFKQ